ncbi:MAG: sporulation peptidase YabG [Clostridia bacterium]|nr:sporulation peptidase YabG [Clostridia bacterium]
MNRIKKGDVVARKSYGKDIIFTVKNIINTKKEKIAILKGFIDRIEADSNIEDLEIVDKQIIAKKQADLHYKLNDKIIKEKENRGEDYRIGIVTPSSRNKEKIVTGKILHLDGDKKYSQKSYYYYKKLGLNAIVKNIPEYRQPRVIYKLLQAYNPDILVITGHDGMIKRGTDYNNIYNYRNSKYFIQTVKEARRYDLERNSNLVIFAGACQSYFEAIISAGANFASSPARILIDFLDPLVIAEKIAFTEKYKYITIDDIAKELRDGKKGVSGIGANGKMIKEID